MSRRRRSSRRSRLHGLGALDTGTMLIGAGVVVGLGTLAYYFMRETPPDVPQKTDAYRTAAQQYVAQMQAAQPYKAARDAYVAANATYTKSLYE